MCGYLGGLDKGEGHLDDALEQLKMLSEKMCGGGLIEAQYVLGFNRGIYREYIVMPDLCLFVVQRDGMDLGREDICSLCRGAIGKVDEYGPEFEKIGVLLEYGGFRTEKKFIF